MNEEKPKRKFTSRVSFRIVILLAAVMAVGLLILAFHFRHLVKDYIESYYARSGEKVSEFVSLYLGESIVSEDFVESPEASILMALCRENDLERIFLEVSEPPYHEGMQLFYITKDHIPNKEEIKEIQKRTYELSEEERKIFLGLDQDEVGIFRSISTGNRLLAYLHGIYDDNGTCLGIVGTTFLYDDLMNELTAGIRQTTLIIAVVFFSMMAIFLAVLRRMVLRPIEEISRNMTHFVEGDRLNAQTMEVSGTGELAEMAGAYNNMAEEIRKYIADVAVMNAERGSLETEMHAAAHIQKGMLPDPTFEDPEVSLRTVLKPARYVGGDFYDYGHMPDGRMYFAIADVSGKGISAAMFMTSAVSAIRYNTRLGGTPGEVLTAANRDLCEKNREQLFVTAFVAVYDPETRILTCANAGHNPPFLVREEVKALDQGSGVVLGLFPEEVYEDVSAAIRPDDVLFLYTDGLSETVSSKREFFGKKRLKETLARILCEGRGCAADPAEEVYREAVSFAAGAEQHDDITILTVRFCAHERLVLPAQKSRMSDLKSLILGTELVPVEWKKKICLAAEEIFVNICSYAYEEGTAGEAVIDITDRGDSLEITFSDSGIAYNPLEEVITPEEVDPDLQIGGLGKLLAFAVTDEMQYTYKNGCNILKMIRYKQEKPQEKDS